jgi:tRNA/tmRNA/rRNA uracil-C5-methylase (TrmA/RlmC/RlmD family)
VQANYGAMQRCLAAIAAATPAGASVVELYAGCGVIGLALAAQVRLETVFHQQELCLGV